MAGSRVGVFLRCTGQEDPLLALRAVKTLGLDMVQVRKLPDRFYTPEGAREFAELLRESGFSGALIIENYVARGLKTDPMDELRIARTFLDRAGW